MEIKSQALVDVVEDVICVVTALKGLIKKPENPISVDSMNPIGATKQDRLSQVTVIAEEIFEDKAVAISWMTTVNDALGGKTPIFLCDTEIGARQVLRVSHAIEWGGCRVLN